MDQSNNSQLIEPVIDESLEEKLKRQRRQWHLTFYAKKKEQLLEKSRICDICGNTYNYYNKRNHMITRFHKKAVAKLEEAKLEEQERQKKIDEIVSSFQKSLIDLLNKTI